MCLNLLKLFRKKIFTFDRTIYTRPQCVNEEYKREDPITAYRLYYARSKSHLHKWTKRDVPKFIETFS